jgi:hypothetical protein
MGVVNFVRVHSKKQASRSNEQHMLRVLKHYLPTQGPLKDFVHHNTLHAFQDMKFYDAIFKASAIFGYQTTFSLTEYRDLYAIKRITPEILARVIHERKGDRDFDEWRSNCLHKAYDATKEPRVGNLRDQWRQHYPIDMDNAVHPLLFRIVCAYLIKALPSRRSPMRTKAS